MVSEESRREQPNSELELRVLKLEKELKALKGIVFRGLKKK